MEKKLSIVLSYRKIIHSLDYSCYVCIDWYKSIKQEKYAYIDKQADKYAYVSKLKNVYLFCHKESSLAITIIKQLINTTFKLS